MSSIPPLSISHTGFHVFNMKKMVRIFTSVYGFHVVDHGPHENLEEIIFLSTDHRDHHQLVLYSGRTKDDEKIHYNHVSFRADALERLHNIRRKLEKYPGVTRIGAINHGNAWSLYCFDPEGNRTEIFVDTDWHVAQPFGVPLDLALSDDAIRQLTEKMLESCPTAMPFDEWRKKQAEIYGIDSS